MVSPHLMEIVYSLTKVHPPDQGFLNEFFRLCFKQSLEHQGKSPLRVKTITTLMMDLSEKKIFDVTAKIEIWLMYSAEFKNKKHGKEFTNFLTNLSANGVSK